MTPERLTQLVPNLLKILSPPSVTFPQGNPAAACQWLTGIQNLPALTDAADHTHPLWPQAPEVSVNTYTVASAPVGELLPGIGDGPTSLINIPGINPLDICIPPIQRSHRVEGWINGANGELAFERTDLIMPGPLPFHWKRYYRSSITEDCGIGTGWRHSLSEQLSVQDNTVELYTAEGRRVRFQLPAIGHGCYNRFERLLLFRQSLHSYRLTSFNEPHKIFRADGVNSALPLTEIRDQFGNALTIDYSEGLPRKIVTSWGRVVEFQLHGGRISRLLNNHAPEEQRNLCMYDFHGGLLTDAYRGCGKERYNYHDLCLTEIRCSQSGSSQFEYDHHGRCHKLRHEETETLLSWQHTHSSCLVETIDRDPLQLRFNRFGQLVSEEQGLCRNSWLYDTYGNLCQHIGAGGQRTFYRYDELGRIRRSTRAGVSSRYQYDRNGFPEGILLNGDQVWRYRFSDKGRPLTIVDPEQQEWNFLYSDRGQLTQITDPEGGRVDFAWDGQGQLQTARCGEKVWGFEYDHWQRMSAMVVNEETWREWRYGPEGELRESRIGKHQYGLDYSERGLPYAIHAGNSQSLHCEYDSAGNICQIQFADGNSWELHCNAHGQLTQLDTPNGYYRWHYDPIGQLVSYQTPDKRHLRWHYNTDGTLSEYCDNDCRWYFHYSENGAVAGIRNNNGQNNEFHYDARQRLIQANNLHSSVRFKYDQRNRVIAENHDSSDVRDFSLRYQYDSRGWLKSVSSDNLDLAYTLAPCGSLYGIDANGEPILRTEVVGQNHVHVQGDVRSTYKFESGRLAALESGLALTWQFDRQAPLQLTTPIRPAGFAQAQIERDKRGNVTGEREMPGRKDYQYQYDGWGLMSTAECGEFKTYFRYDPFGRRLSKTCTHRKSARQRRVTTSWSGLGIWAEVHQIDGKSRGIGHWIQHPLYRSILCHWSSGNNEHYLTGAEGKPLAIFDAQGAIQWSRGSETGTTADSGFGQEPGPWRGTNLIADIETGLWYHTSGYWNPALQIWLNGTRVFFHTTPDTPLPRL